MTALFLYGKEIKLMRLVINEDLDTVKSTLHNTNIIRKVDSSGTINIPKSIRESIGIEANDEVYLYVDNTNNTIAIRKVNSDYIAEDDADNINTNYI
jgi:AbrB family looped-hinge helix DNA binding protein